MSIGIFADLPLAMLFSGDLHNGCINFGAKMMLTPMNNPNCIDRRKLFANRSDAPLFKRNRGFGDAFPK